MVELPYLGRNGTLAISTSTCPSSPFLSTCCPSTLTARGAVLTGAFLLASTTARTSDALLGWNCGYSLTNNVMWGVLFAVTPELFPAKDRGTGNSVVELGDRIFNLFVSPVLSCPGMCVRGVGADGVWACVGPGYRVVCGLDDGGADMAVWGAVYRRWVFSVPLAV